MTDKITIGEARRLARKKDQKLLATDFAGEDLVLTRDVHGVGVALFESAFAEKLGPYYLIYAEHSDGPTVLHEDEHCVVQLKRREIPETTLADES